MRTHLFKDLCSGLSCKADILRGGYPTGWISHKTDIDSKPGFGDQRTFEFFFKSSHLPTFEKILEKQFYFDLF